MSKIKAILILSTVFLVTSFSAIFLFQYYTEFVRSLFRLFGGEHIFHIQKIVLPFFSITFDISFGIFCVLLSYLLFRQSNKAIILYLALAIIIFFATTLITTFIDSSIKTSGCVICTGILRYMDVNYDIHFIISLIMALLPPGLRRLKLKDSFTAKIVPVPA